MNKIYGNGKKKHANIRIRSLLVGRVIYYYWSEDDNGIIRLLDINKHIIAQFDTKQINVELEDEDYDEVVE